MAQFPANVPTFTTKVDIVDDIMAAHVNMLQDEVRTIAQVIGTGTGAADPRTPAAGGSGATVHTRLQHVEINKEPKGTAAALLGGAFAMGGTGGNRVDFDGDTSFQGRRNSDGAAQSLYLNWWGGGKVYVKDLETNDFYNQGQSNVHNLHARTDVYAVGTIDGNYITSRGTLYAAGEMTANTVRGRNGTSVFTTPSANTWDSAQVLASASGGSSNSIFAAWANNTASVIKWFSGNGYWDFLTGSGNPADGHVAIKVGDVYYASSRRYKHDITDLDLGLAEVMAMRPVSFRLNAWRDQSHVVDPTEESPELSAGYRRDMETPNLGFIAEEMDEVVPNSVGYTDADATPESINYSSLIPVLTKAIQEQQAMIETLQAEVAALKAS